MGAERESTCTRKKEQENVQRRHTLTYAHSHAHTHTHTKHHCRKIRTFQIRAYIAVIIRRDIRCHMHIYYMYIKTYKYIIIYIYMHSSRYKKPNLHMSCICICICMYSLLHLPCHLTSFSILNLIGLFSTKRGQKTCGELDNRLRFEIGEMTLQMQ